MGTRKLAGQSRGALKHHQPTKLETPCRVYRGPLTEDGYGLKRSDAIKRGTKATLAYCSLTRWVMEQGIGRKLEKWEKVLHRCDNPPCFRFDHLRIGTDADNAADRAAKGRSSRSGPGASRRFADNHSCSKLTSTEVLEIRRLAASGVPPVALARRYSCSATNIYSIVKRLTWRDVPPAG